MKSIMKWIAALACLAGGWWMFQQAPAETENSEETYRALAWAAGGFLLIATAAALCIAPIGRWLVDLIEVVMLPSGGSYTAPALYKLPEYYIREGRYGDALAEYEKIQKNHPRDLAAFEGRLYVLHACMGNTAAAETLFKKGLRRVGKDRVAELEAYMAALHAGTALAPERSLEP